ncbi:MAG: NADH-quinone oxidoreductase subunit H, partial [Candidatus Bipolaricaulota bacterium]|nr:NADH-quinone oxidoreductase subunit H [Candidatus Bipolaricaulota bacterium]
MTAGMALVNILVFPGLLFLVLFGLAGEFVDRKLCARLQNRVGPPWFQPAADFLKLLGKENVVPEEADRRMFALAPVFAFASVIAASLYIPLWNAAALLSFQGDLIVVLYLLMIPTLTFFLGGWYSRSIFATLGAVRSITQLFAYEIPLFIAVLAPSLLANTWSISGMAAYYSAHPWLWPVNLIGFGVALVALLGKLERVPFDIPEAETEIVAGIFTEYSGRRLAFFRLAIDCEAIVGASLLVAVFLPVGLGLNPWLGFVIYLAKVLAIVGILALLRTVFARLRIDQMIDFCWKYVAP